jgi:hypothetical protein
MTLGRTVAAIVPPTATVVLRTAEVVFQRALAIAGPGARFITAVLPCRWLRPSGSRVRHPP